ncbi:MAG: FAD-dependent oxidoreductase [Hyphomicrobiales bacterium]|nr:FAD-dependent oxidoreductase [Hyphomicrobiales bacterium]
MGEMRQATVVGAGIVGVCAALSLLEKGFAVRVVDPDPPADGASYGNAGVISCWACVPQAVPGIWKNVPKWLLDPEGPIFLRPAYALRALPWALKFFRAGAADRVPAIADAMLALNHPTIDLYRGHLAGTGRDDLVRDSCYVHVFRDPAMADLNRYEWRLRAERGVPLRRVDAGELHEIEPDLSPDYTAGILVERQARAVDPGGLGKVLAEKAASLGAEFLRARARRLIPREGGGCAVETDGAAGTVEADIVVLAAGAWSARLLAPLGVTVPLEAEHGYHMIMRDPGVTANNSVLDMGHKFVASTMSMGLRCAGTVEFAGLDAAPNYARARVFERLAKRLFPAVNTADTEEWRGTRPSFPDSLPCIGPVPGHPSIITAFGHGHLGLTMGPKTGQLVAALAAGETPNMDMAPYRVDRF